MKKILIVVAIVAAIIVSAGARSVAAPPPPSYTSATTAFGGKAVASAAASATVGLMSAVAGGECSRVSNRGPSDTLRSVSQRGTATWKVTPILRGKACPDFLFLKRVEVKFKHVSSTGGVSRCQFFKEFRANPDFIGSYNPRYLETPCFNGSKVLTLSWVPSDEVTVYRSASAATRCLGGPWSADGKDGFDPSGSLGPACVKR